MWKIGLVMVGLLYGTAVQAGWATPDGPGGAAFQSDDQIRAELTRPRIIVPPAAPAPPTQSYSLCEWRTINGHPTQACIGGNQ